jgi:phage/plasmid primase-like uncharacterized protein
MISADAIARARAVRLEDEIARRGLKLRRTGAELIGPCPVCGGTDRFSINVRKKIFNCRGCGTGGDIIKLVEHLDGCDFAAAIATLAGNTARATPQYKPAPAQRDDHNDDEQRRLEQADAIWRSSSPLGPDAIAYFSKRGININDVPEHGGLRFHARCPWQDGTVPAIVARFTTAIGNEPRGIWRRPISGEKPMTLGQMAGCVIRLWPDEAVKQGLVIGEGVETCISAATRISHRGTLLQPAWAVGGSGNLKNFPILSGVEALTILVDNDVKSDGQKAAAKCAARWSAAGREVIRLTPKIVDADFNDVVRA